MANKSKSDGKTYTKPDLREKIKAEILGGDKGGKPGQWSARKAQMVAHEYERQGGGYKQPPDEKQQSLKEWGDEHWTTADGKPAVREGGKTARYLPEEAWAKLTPGQKRATNRKKLEGSEHGEQFVSNTRAAASARKQATEHVAAKTKKTSAKKTGAKKAPAKKAPAKKTPAKKTPAKKTPAKKVVARKK